MSISYQQFDKFAVSYQQSAHVQRRALDQLLSVFSDQLNPSIKSLLDLGCGPASGVELFRERWPDVAITGVDHSPAMIEVASKAYPQASWHCNDLTRWKGDAVDLVISSGTVQWVDDLSSALTTMQQHLKPNGKLLLSAFGPETFRELSDCLTDHTGDEVLLTAQRFRPIEDYDRQLRSTWTNVHSKRLMIKQPYDSLVSLLQNIQRTGTRGQGVKGVTWTPGLIQALEALYRQRFGKIWATYDIYLGVAYD